MEPMIDEAATLKSHYERMAKKLEDKMAQLEMEITGRKRTETALLESESRYKYLYSMVRLMCDNLPDLIWTKDLENRFVFTNKACCEKLLNAGDTDEPVGKTNMYFANREKESHPENSEYHTFGETCAGSDLVVLETKKPLRFDEAGNLKGKIVYLDVYKAPFWDEKGNLIGTVGCARDITREKQMEEDRKRAEQELRESEEKYRTVVESSMDAIMLLTPEEGFLSGNSAAVKIFGCKDEKEFTSQTPQNLFSQYQPDGTLSSEKDKQIMAIAMEKGSHFFEWTYKRMDGQEFPATVLLTKMELQGRRMLQAMVRDITEHKKAHEERKKLEARLRQAQKMEAIGLLAGGVAHDFNNLLTVIIGNAQLALMNVIKDKSLRKEIEEIEKAGERAASLTSQLLAFSRKQIVQPDILDINELLTNMEKMLGRLIGEDVELVTIPEPELWQVEADPGQMEQVIMNLAVNATEAMPKGGKLSIETANIDLSENYFHEHAVKNEPGSYVMLTVSDTGSGMDKKTQEHIFEPFFTTKEVGKGTGLGLSTVYGIVKQNNGFVWVYSESGQGSTFKVYLPKAKGDTEPEEKEQTLVDDLSGSETVLIVEDDDGLRKFAQEVLLRHGYRVLDAENGEDALSVSQAHEGPIHLMITDVVMPRMGGRETTERLQPLYPQMKVIYMSGYTDNAIVQHGVLAPGLNFLEKPFTPESLARKVREMLDKSQS